MSNVPTCNTCVTASVFTTYHCMAVLAIVLDDCVCGVKRRSFISFQCGMCIIIIIIIVFGIDDCVSCSIKRCSFIATYDRGMSNYFPNIRNQCITSAALGIDHGVSVVRAVDYRMPGSAFFRCCFIANYDRGVSNYFSSIRD
jgi:hypothetical protein